MKKKKNQKKLRFGATPFFLLLSMPFLFVGVDFVWRNPISFDRCIHYFSGDESSYINGRSANKTNEEQQFINFHLARLVRGDDRRKLDATGFACDKAFHSIHCVSTKSVRIDAGNMTVYIPSDADRDHETTIRPYARQEDELKQITPVHMVQYTNTTTPPPCHVHHSVPAVVFSSGSTGNFFHEMNEIIIPLYITIKQFQSRVVFFLEDYNPSFVSKYGSFFSRLSAYDVINPAKNSTTVHCFPAAIVGLKYHDHLAVNSSDIPGGYGMPDFRHFLRDMFRLKAAHVSQIARPRPRLVLLSRTSSRRFLNEDEMIILIKDIGFEVTVVKRSKLASNLKRFSQLINSCSVILGAHGAGLTNVLFLPAGGVMIQVEPLGTDWASNHYFGDTVRAMGVHYLGYKIEGDESSLVKVYGRNSSVVTDPGSVGRDGGYRAARTVFFDQQNVKLNLVRFRETLVEAFSMVMDYPAR